MTKHIAIAVERMSDAYPEYRALKPTSSAGKWKERAINAEARVIELEETLKTLKSAMRQEVANDD